MLKNLVNIAILTTIVIVVWVFVSIYNSFTQSTISTNVAKQIDPISPGFNINTITDLQQRTFVPTDLSETIVLPTDADGTTPASSSAAFNESLQSISSELSTPSSDIIPVNLVP